MDLSGFMRTITPVLESKGLELVNCVYAVWFLVMTLMLLNIFVVLVLMKT